MLHKLVFTTEEYKLIRDCLEFKLEWLVGAALSYNSPEKRPIIKLLEQFQEFDKVDEEAKRLRYIEE